MPERVDAANSLKVVKTPLSWRSSLFWILMKWTGKPVCTDYVPTCFLLSRNDVFPTNVQNGLMHILKLNYTEIIETSISFKQTSKTHYCRKKVTKTNRHSRLMCIYKSWKNRHYVVTYQASTCHCVRKCYFSFISILKPIRDVYDLRLFYALKPMALRMAVFSYASLHCGLLSV